MSDYNADNKARIQAARTSSYDHDVDGDKIEWEDIHEKDWWKEYTHHTHWHPAEPYQVYIDGHRYCALVHRGKSYIHLLLGSGYHTGVERRGQHTSQQKQRRLAIIPRHRVAAYDAGSHGIFIAESELEDWTRCYQRGYSEKRYKPKRYGDDWAYNVYVDQLVKHNQDKLKSYPISDDSDQRTEGEHHIATNLQKLDLRYIPEKVIDEWEQTRIADFYLPREDLYVEFQGTKDSTNPKTKEQGLKRYAAKQDEYKDHNKRFIEIEPDELHRVQHVLSTTVSEVLQTGESVTKPETAETGRIIQRKEAQIQELEQQIKELQKGPIQKVTEGLANLFK